MLKQPIMSFVQMFYTTNQTEKFNILSFPAWRVGFLEILASSLEDKIQYRGSEQCVCNGERHTEELFGFIVMEV